MYTMQSLKLQNAPPKISKTRKIANLRNHNNKIKQIFNKSADKSRGNFPQKAMQNPISQIEMTPSLTTLGGHLLYRGFPEDPQ